MRVTRIPGDFYDISESPCRPCRVWLNEAEITDWTVADDFRRVVETPDGARFGAVRIDLSCAESVAQPEIPVTSLSGMFVVEPKPEAPAVEIVEAPKDEAAPSAPMSEPWPILTPTKPAPKKRSRKVRK